MRQLPPRVVVRVLLASRAVGEGDHRVASAVDDPGADEADVLRRVTARATERNPVLAAAAARLQRAAETLSRVVLVGVARGVERDAGIDQERHAAPHHDQTGEKRHVVALGRKFDDRWRDEVARRGDCRALRDRVVDAFGVGGTRLGRVIERARRNER